MASPCLSQHRQQGKGNGGGTKAGVPAWWGGKGPNKGKAQKVEELGGEPGRVREGEGRQGARGQCRHKVQQRQRWGYPKPQEGGRGYWVGVTCGVGWGRGWGSG